MSIRYGAHQVGYATPAPAFTNRRHETPVAGDSQSAILRASGGCLDTNVLLIHFQRLGVTFVCLGHWPYVGRNGYTHWKDAHGKLHPLSRAQKKLTLQAWVDRHGGDVAALNMLHKRGGGRRKRPIHDYAMTWEQAVIFADRCDTAMTPECKSQGFKNPGPAQYMDKVCQTHDYPLWPMTLLNMKYAKEKCEQFRKLNKSFALIFGKFRNQAKGANKIAGWTFKPTQIWGPASARQWLRS